MEAQDQIAQALYGRGVEDEAVLRAMDTAHSELSEEQRREDLYLSSLAAYVRALGGRVEVHAVFAQEDIIVRSEPPAG